VHDARGATRPLDFSQTIFHPVIPGVRRWRTIPFLDHREKALATSQSECQDVREQFVERIDIRSPSTGNQELEARSRRSRSLPTAPPDAGQALFWLHRVLPPDKNGRTAKLARRHLTGLGNAS